MHKVSGYTAESLTREVKALLRYGIVLTVPNSAGDLLFLSQYSIRHRARMTIESAY